MKKPGIVAVIGIALLLIVALSVISSGFYIIEAGERGVVLTLGKPSKIPTAEGPHLKIPVLQQVVKMDIKTQKYETQAAAASRDLQTIHTNIAVNYHPIAEETPLLYTEIGLHYSDRVIQPSVQEVVKASTAKFTADELITHREQVRDTIKDALTQRLKDRRIIVEDISITNFEFSQSFNQVIEQKVTAEQLKLKADRDLQRIRIEADQKIATAQAEAESLRLQKAEISPELIQLRAVEKWDGKLPQVVGAGSTPFIPIEPAKR